jgi:hypothetical protein
MRTNDQQAAIHGESTFQFLATIGESIEIVDVTLGFEYDYQGPYNEFIKSVLYKGVDISGCLTLETLNSLEIDGIYKRDAK